MATEAAYVDFTEGAAPSTPGTGVRRVYAKTDGIYEKDDAGTEAGPIGSGSGGGDVATDAIWDAAGDLAVGSGVDTATKLSIGNAGGAVSRINGAVAWNSGTSFPTAATGDRYWRTDLEAEFFYDGTRWLSTQVHSVLFQSQGTDISATSSAFRVGIPTALGTSLWLERYDCLWRVATTNDGSNYWTMSMRKWDGTTQDTIASFTTASGSADTLTRTSADVGSAIDASTELSFISNEAKTSAPGNINTLSWVLHLRYVAT